MENKIPAWDANAPLHIGSSITLGTCLLPSLVKVYQEQHPEIKIYVTVKIPAQSSRQSSTISWILPWSKALSLTRKSFQRSFLPIRSAWSQLPAIRLPPTGRSPSPTLLPAPSFYANQAVPAGKSSKVSFIRRHPDRARLGKRQHPRPHPRRPKRSRHRNFTGASRPGCTEIRRSCLPSASARHPDPQPIPDPAPQQIPFVLRRGISEFMPDVEILSG